LCCELTRRGRPRRAGRLRRLVGRRFHPEYPNAVRSQTAAIGALSTPNCCDPRCAPRRSRAGRSVTRLQGFVRLMVFQALLDCQVARRHGPSGGAPRQARAGRTGPPPDPRVVCSAVGIPAGSRGATAWTRAGVEDLAGRCCSGTQPGTREQCRKLHAQGILQRPSATKSPHWKLGALARHLSVKTQTLSTWRRRGWVHADRNGNHWLLWADTDELRRLQRLAAHDRQELQLTPGNLTTPKQR